MGRLSFSVCTAALMLALFPLNWVERARADDEAAAPAQLRQKVEKKFGGLGPVYDLAVRFAKAGDYERAITLLKALKRDEDPRVLNYLGYSTRKLGNPAEAVPYYEKALSLEPEFVVAREYLGEAWLQLNQPDKAAVQLAEIEKVCGTDCLPYRDLANAIAAHATGKPIPVPSAAW